MISVFIRKGIGIRCAMGMSGPDENVVKGDIFYQMSGFVSKGTGPAQVINVYDGKPFGALYKNDRPDI